MPDGNIVFGGSGTNRTVRITPLADQAGTATITVTVNDGTLFASREFELNVNARPVANDDLVTTYVARAIEITWNELFANDVDDDSPKSGWFISEVVAIAGGAVTNKPETQTIVFTPTSSLLDKGQFSYTLDDGKGATDIAIVSVVMAWQNQANRRDVNSDGTIAPMDVVNIVNELNDHKYSDPTGKLANPRPTDAVYNCDVNGDGFVTTNDAIIVINYLNEHGGPESESSSFPLLFMPSTVTPLPRLPTDTTPR